jgi:hypothetical protein
MPRLTTAERARVRSATRSWLFPAWRVRVWAGIAAFGVAASVLVSQASAGTYGDWTALHRPLHLPRVAVGGACPVSRIDPSVAWKRTNIFGGSGIGRGPVYPGLGSSAGRLDATPNQSRSAVGVRIAYLRSSRGQSEVE